MPKVNPIPKGFHSINVTLTCKNAVAAIDWYKKALGAEEVSRAMSPDGKKVMHAELRIGDSSFMLNDEFPEMNCVSPQTLGGTPVGMWIYCDNVDALFANATKHGATVTMPVGDMFWGDRFGQVVCPEGHRWSLATHIEDLTQEEQDKRAQEFFAGAAACSK